MSICDGSCRYESYNCPYKAGKKILSGNIKCPYYLPTTSKGKKEEENMCGKTIEEVIKANNNISRKYEEVREEKNSLEEEYQVLKDEFDKVEETCQELASKNGKLRKKNQKLNGVMRDKDMKLSNIKKQIKELKQTNKELENEIDNNYKENCKELEKKLNKQYELFSNEVDDLERMVDNKTIRIQTLEEHSNSLLEKNRKLEKKLKLISNISELLGEID
jgi:chromosome segregation ATPase